MMSGELNRYLSGHCETAEGYPRAVFLFPDASTAKRYQIEASHRPISQEQE